LDYYKANVSAADALLFSNMPWISANVGDKFTVPGIEGRKPKPKLKRKIFVKHASAPIEVNISESRFEYSNLAPGDGLQLKGEFDCNKRFQIYVVENRKSDNRWDVFSEQIGVVDHVNKDRNVIHFIIDKEVEGVVSFADLADTFSEGDAIAVKLVSYTSAKGKVHRVLNAVATDQIPSKLVKKQFCEVVRVSNGMGFTENDIFISPSLVSEQQIKDGQKISGEAVLNYNKKRENWGWKAITLEFNEQ
jgi:hypothetical protein